MIQLFILYCIFLSDIDPYLIFGNRYYVRRLGTDGSNYSKVSDEHEYTHVLDYNYQV